jgi:hypothetical protein
MRAGTHLLYWVSQGYLFDARHLKNILYAERIHDLLHLRRRTDVVLATVTPDMRALAWDEIESCSDICKATHSTSVRLVEFLR